MKSIKQEALIIKNNLKSYSSKLSIEINEDFEKASLLTIEAIRNMYPELTDPCDFCSAIENKYNISLGLFKRRLKDIVYFNENFGTTIFEKDFKHKQILCVERQMFLIARDLQESHHLSEEIKTNLEKMKYKSKIKNASLSYINEIEENTKKTMVTIPDFISSYILDAMKESFCFFDNDYDLLKNREIFDKIPFSLLHVVNEKFSFVDEDYFEKIVFKNTINNIICRLNELSTYESLNDSDIEIFYKICLSKNNKTLMKNYIDDIKSDKIKNFISLKLKLSSF